MRLARETATAVAPSPRQLPLKPAWPAMPDPVAALADVPGRNELERRRVAARMFQLWQYLHSEPAERTSLRELARVSGYSPWHLQRVFKRMFGVAPKAISARRKVEAAAQLLWTSDEPVEVVSRRAGFVNRSAFSRVFKKSYGLTPREFRAARDDADGAAAKPFCDVLDFERRRPSVADTSVSDSCDRGNHA